MGSDPGDFNGEEITVKTKNGGLLKLNMKVMEVTDKDKFLKDINSPKCRFEHVVTYPQHGATCCGQKSGILSSESPNNLTKTPFI